MKPAIDGCCGVPANQPWVKTLSFAVLHFSIAFMVAYLLTGSVLTGGLIALIEPACNTVAFYFHERWWGRSRAVAPSRAYGHGSLMGAVESPRRRE